MGTTANRQDWEWQFSGLQLEEASAAKATYHEERAQQWADKKDDLEAQLRESGVQFREMPITGGNRVDAVIDPHLQMTLNEATSKHREHLEKAKEYHRWERAFARAPAQHHTLKLDDIAHFGL